MPSVLGLLEERESAARVRVEGLREEAARLAGVLEASYEDGRAEQRFADLRQSLASCRTYEGVGWVGKFTATVAPAPTPSFGDEAVSYTETIPMGAERGGDRNETFVVVRSGNTIASFSALNVGGSSSFPTGSSPSRSNASAQSSSRRTTATTPARDALVRSWAGRLDRPSCRAGSGWSTLV
ncbi:hypothetical protein ACFXD5_19380 [Streptomyces sp. NPDC059385]|uniref:hypothetical protein n=1 Tax=Streptomyces sp. NPDC059385 TaxID=3346817 RepID=UPI003684E40A